MVLSRITTADFGQAADLAAYDVSEINTHGNDVWIEEMELAFGLRTADRVPLGSKILSPVASTIPTLFTTRPTASSRSLKIRWRHGRRIVGNHRPPQKSEG